ncbi:sigma-54-dependent transcriptional regulator [Desulfovibrio inopinatus]|uniref:sigma-54-dependent transcriptional regulator n=1 Tax=Desulfovibrio inopinatus TaxID=102109 RepID=UPI0003FFF7A7|nr:sigma-54 dependent transcriptional regulator [Desulfovibrio inopinatus]
MANILIIDDDPVLCRSMAASIADVGHEAHIAYSLEQGRSILADVEIDVVFLDVVLPDGDGMKEVEQIKHATSHPEVIIITGYGGPEGAEAAVKSGAWDYLCKPISDKEMMLPLLRALQYRREKHSSRRQEPLHRDRIIGNSPAMQKSLELVAQASAGDANILLVGETGVGKELFARAIHDNSRRKNGPFVVVDCAALPETLIEATLFGHVRGAFTGADKDKTGLIRMADGGSLFLDEIGELPLPLQRGFLRVLQERVVRPVGSNKEFKSDFRLISATNRNLDSMAADGTFREDLLFRLKTMRILLPPLRERREDIRQLLVYYAPRLAAATGVSSKIFAPEFIQTLLQYDWPGNVREFISTLEIAILAAGNAPTLYPAHLPESVRITAVKKRTHEAIHTSRSDILDTPLALPETIPTLKEFRDEMIEFAEEKYLQYVVRVTKADIKAMLSLSGLSKSRFYELLRKYNIQTKT